MGAVLQFRGLPFVLSASTATDTTRMVHPRIYTPHFLVIDGRTRVNVARLSSHHITCLTETSVIRSMKLPSDACLSLGHVLEKGSVWTLNKYQAARPRPGGAAAVCHQPDFGN
jgi:hypothetical protein